MAREIELKLAFPPESLKLIGKHPLITASTRVGRAETLENTYYDTPDQALGKALIAVRTRRIGRRWLQTIKSANASAGGLSSRPEWEQPYDKRTDRFDFSGVDDASTRALLEQHADDIRPLFTTTFRRETRAYKPRPGVHILLMIDTGNVRSPVADGFRETPISELELELVEGTASDLLDYAIMLGADLPLMPEDISKAQRGYLLLEGKRPSAVRAQRLSLDASMTLDAAFRALAFECLHGWQANALGALVSDEPEFIHQLRVALRRMRTLLDIFEKHLPPNFSPTWKTQLERLASGVGQARDLDVMYESLLEAPLQGSDAPAYEALMRHLRATSDATHAQVRTELHSAAARRLLLEFSKALHTLPEQTASIDVQAFARDCMRHLHQRVAKRLKRAQETDARADRHRVRIALKRLRYALEFFVSLFDDKIGDYRRKQAKILEELGELNDINVGRSTLQRWSQEHEELREISSWITGWHAAHEARRNRRVLKDVAELLSMPSPWKKSRNLKNPK